MNLLYHLADHLSRGFPSADDQFQARRLKWLKIFSLWFPGFRNKKPKWLKFKKYDILRFWFSLVNLSFCWDTLLLFLLFWILVIMVFCLPFVLLRQKGGVFFVLDQKCISEPVKCFLSQNGQMGSLLVFYIGNILVDKNTLCNGCFLTGLSVLFRIFMYSDNIQIKACD
jgi:hypothetical protein